jgi:hypothetical protein
MTANRGFTSRGHVRGWLVRYLEGGNPSHIWRLETMLQRARLKCVSTTMVSPVHAIPPIPRKSKRGRQAAKAEIRKILDEFSEAHLLVEHFRKAHCEAQRRHALGGVNSMSDPERWRGPLEKSAAAVVTIKGRLANAVEVLKGTYKSLEAFEALDTNERFWTAPRIVRAGDAIAQHRSDQFLRRLEEMQGKASIS